MKIKNIENSKIAIIGLGYVGLPLAVEFSKKYKTIGYDINVNRINELKNNIDVTNEIVDENLYHLKNINLTSVESDIASANIYIITVPTPVDINNNPNLEPIISATRLVASFIDDGDIIIYESTVYPGVTEEICVPVIENLTKLKYNINFYCGYSPERINPGDKTHTLINIKKITSGSTPEASNFINNLYSSIIVAGTFKASCIKVAEAAKVIENAQRDINIAFMNEISKIFNNLEIDTLEVLEAAGTKWNFLGFRPGLVGGHCIGVDPYYLAQKAQLSGHYPELILAARRVNDGMGEFIANQIIKLLIIHNFTINYAKVLILGITFKENCPDIRNTRVIDIYNSLKNYNIKVDITDPHASKKDVQKIYNVDLIEFNLIKIDEYDLLILAVSHVQFNSINLEPFINSGKLVYDIKSFFPKNLVSKRL